MKTDLKAKWGEVKFLQDGRIEVSLKVDKASRSQVLSLADEVKDFDLKVGIDKWKEKRSLDANAYCWVLIDKLAQRLNKDPEDIYKEEIRHTAGVSSIICIPQKAADMFCTNWEKKGSGWMTERSESKLEGCVNVKVWYGSSTYDTAQMSRLIENVVQDCREQGIETMDEEDLRSLIKQWGEK